MLAVSVQVCVVGLVGGLHLQDKFCGSEKCECCRKSKEEVYCGFWAKDDGDRILVDGDGVRVCDCEEVEVDCAPSGPGPDVPVDDVKMMKDEEDKITSYVIDGDGMGKKVYNNSLRVDVDYRDVITKYSQISYDMGCGCWAVARAALYEYAVRTKLKPAEIGQRSYKFGPTLSYLWYSAHGLKEGYVNTPSQTYITGVASGQTIYDMDDSAFTTNLKSNLQYGPNVYGVDGGKSCSRELIHYLTAVGTTGSKVYIFDPYRMNVAKTFKQGSSMKDFCVHKSEYGISELWETSRGTKFYATKYKGPYVHNAGGDIVCLSSWFRFRTGTAPLPER